MVPKGLLWGPFPRKDGLPFTCTFWETEQGIEDVTVPGAHEVGGLFLWLTQTKQRRKAARLCVPFSPPSCIASRW